MTLPPEIIALIQQLRGEIAGLQQKNADLRRRLGLDSSTSSKPPSSDGLGKKARIKTNLRGRSGKRSGGQVGHRGDTLRQVSEPDKVERHEATACADCQNALTPSMETAVERRQVFDLVAPRLEVVEHQGVVYRCACCRATTRAAFPAAVTGYVQYGKGIQATALYLNAQQLVPEDRVSDIMRDLFGAGGKTAKRTGHNLLVRLRDFKAETLRFLVDFDVPFTNNQAEQDVRMMKVKMKISGGFRSTAGANTFATLRSVLSTARKQGWDMLKTLNATPPSLIHAFRA